MKNTIGNFIICAALLACLSLGGAQTTGNGYHQSGVLGQVQGEILFHDWNVLVLSDEGEVVADFLTDEHGSFEVDLKPGMYLVVAYITDVGPFPLVFGTPVTVTVDKKQFATVLLPISLPPQ